MSHAAKGLVIILLMMSNIKLSILVSLNFGLDFVCRLQENLFYVECLANLLYFRSHVEFLES